MSYLLWTMNFFFIVHYTWLIAHGPCKWTMNKAGPISGPAFLHGFGFRSMNHSILMTLMVEVPVWVFRVQK